jgi:type IV secretion system protein VirB6
MIGDFCNADTGDRFAARVLADTDCQAFSLVERGYAALSQPGSAVSIALTGLMVIAVAFFGFRLLFGHGMVLRDATQLTVKIGIVLLIATSWESWQAVAYHGLARAPTEVAGEMLRAIGAPPPLESLEKMLDDIGQASIGFRTRAGIASPLVGGPAAAAAVLSISAVLLTLFTVGIMVAARVTLAILLAIAPAMAGLILFNGTRGMAQGWLGAMAAAALAPLFILLVAAVEFAVLAPMMSRLLQEQSARVFENSSVMPIGLVTVVFGIATIFALKAGTQIGLGVRLPGQRSAVAPAEERESESRTVIRDSRTEAVSQPTLRVAQALETIARRDASAPASPIGSLGAGRASSSARDARGTRQTLEQPTNVFATRPRAARVRSAPRRSRAAARRDK